MRFAFVSVLMPLPQIIKAFQLIVCTETVLGTLDPKQGLGKLGRLYVPEFDPAPCGHSRIGRFQAGNPSRSVSPIEVWSIAEDVHTRPQRHAMYSQQILERSMRMR